MQHWPNRRRKQSRLGVLTKQHLAFLRSMGQLLYYLYVHTVQDRLVLLLEIHIIMYCITILWYYTYNSADEQNK